MTETEGLRPLAQGREAQVLLRPDGYVLKLWYAAEDGARAEREATALRTLHLAGYPAPVVVDVVTVDGRPGLVMEKVAGIDQLSALGRNPLAVLKAGRALATAHVAIHDCRAPVELPDLHDLLRERMDAAALPGELRSAAHALLDELPHGDSLCHGDLHPGNMLGSWSSPVAIDWGDAARGDPLADVARTVVILRIGEPPPDAPATVQRLAVVGRRALLWRYLHNYRRARPHDADQLERWVLVRAAARLFEDIPAEHPRLVRMREAGFA
ncbi:MAG: phosphotransferase family protein [Acidimicrobiales bacterium]